MPNVNMTGNIQFSTSHNETFKSDSSPTQLNYSLEEERIKSFISWPAHFPVDPLRLAKAGFYYSGLDDEVICFSCQGRIRDWNYGDIVQKKHSTLFPNCDFVNARSNNIPLNQPKEKRINSVLKETVKIPLSKRNLAELMKNINYDKMKYSLSERLNTFTNDWPVKSIDPLKLAQAGFFYLGFQDKVQCPFCNGIVSHWETDDDPQKEHKKHFPWCDFLSCDKKQDDLNKEPWFKPESEDLCGDMKESNLNKTSIHYKLLNKEHSHLNIEKLGVRPYKSPAHPQQASLSARLRSFISWPVHSPVSKEELAKAGFFYTGIRDNTKCFHCNGGLCNWERGDDPWVEHARWFYDCPFLQLNKGDEFIEDCLQKYCPSSVKENSPERTTVFCSEPLMLKVDEAMQLDMVKNVLDTGLFPPYIVRVAVLRQIEETGSNFSDLNELCSAVNYLKSKMEKLPINKEESLDLKLDIRKCSINQVENNTTSQNPIQNINSARNLCTAVRDKLDKTTLNIKNNETSIEDQRLCKICMDKEVGVVFLPCGHLLSCTECAAALEHCPMCRKPIQATIRAYLP